MHTYPTALCAFLFCFPALTAPAAAAPGLQQQDLEHLRRDQEEVLRKAQRMQDMMQRLLVRYEREDRKKEVELLKEGMQHLERSGLLRDVAGIRDDLAAQALSEAVRKQREVVDNLERLLNILLERRSVENLDQEIARTEKMARNARELEKAQRELRDRTAQATRSEPSAAERQLLDRLQELQRQQSAEARTNMRQAGARRPFLEDALKRVQELLERQKTLEQSADREITGEPNPARERMFDLRELTQRTRDLMGSVRDQSFSDRLEQQAEALTEALRSGDQAAVQQAKDRLQAEVQNAPKQPGQEGPVPDQQARQLNEDLQKAGAGENQGERERLQEAAKAARELAEQRRGERGQRNAGEATRLQRDAARTAGTMAEGKKPEAGSPAESAEKAAEALQQAAEAARANQPQEGKPRDPAAGEQTQKALAEALRNLDEARARLEKQNPDATAEAGRMAADAERVARDLKNAPEAEQQERTAAESMQQAEQGLRQANQQMDRAQEQKAAGDKAQKGLQQSRQGLEQAQRTLQEALKDASESRNTDMASAAERQAELQKQAEQAQQQMQQAQQQGAITPAQQQKASERMQEAQKAMQEAQQQLQQGRQSSAASQQQHAAEELQKATQAIEQNRPMNEQQQQALQELAKKEKEILEDIVELAKEAKESQNRQAQQALDQAAQAAERARRAMEEGKPEEALQQQEQARQKLDEAAKALEEEKDRYEDLRQEELLFRMKDELQQILDKQRPITQQTVEIQAAAGRDGLSRPARLQLNQFAEEEQAMAGRTEFMVTALTEEGNLVFRAVLKANQDDLKEVSRRLSGRQPDPGSFTTLLQQDVEHRTEELLAALERERQRREQERQQQQQQQQQQPQSQNRFNPQQQRLVSLIADLQMLKQLELDTRRAADGLKALIALRGDEAITEAEAALIERLGHRHGDVTALFQQIKGQMEQMLEQMQGSGQEQQPKDPPKRGGGK